MIKGHLTIAFALFSVATIAEPAKARAQRAPLSVQFAEAVMARNPIVHEKWDYTAGLVLLAIERVGEAKHNAAMLSYVKSNVDRLVGPDGTISGYKTEDYSLDQIAEGRILFPLTRRTNDTRYARAAALLRNQLRSQPRTADGGFWHKKIYPQQMWLDGLYMGEPFYAEYAKTLGAGGEADSVFTDVTRQFLLAARHTRDARTGLMYHGWDAAKAQRWADTATGLSSSFWGRAVGWYMLGAVETLDYLPANHPGRAELIRTIQNLSEAVTNVQDPVTGLWWQVLDQPNRTGNYLEASASSMFVYAMAKAAHLGYIAPKYHAVAERGFNGLVTTLLKTGADGRPSLTSICQVAGLGGALRKDGSYRDGSYSYYVSEPVVADDYKGVGPFIMAALELGK